MNKYLIRLLKGGRVVDESVQPIAHAAWVCPAYVARFAFLVNVDKVRFLPPPAYPGPGGAVVALPGYRLDEVVQRIDLGIEYVYGGLGI